MKNTVLGKGSYAEVIKYNKDGKDYALKCFRVPINTGLGVSYRELEMMSNVSHPNIINFEGVIEDSIGLRRKNNEEDGRYHILMELGHQNLHKYYTKISVEQAKILARDILLALEYLHHNGIIHRDISVSNILAMNDNDEDQVYKLCDFGMSKHFLSDLDNGGLYLNELYRAPELYSGSTYCEKVDIWSLGSILQELLLGRNPYVSIRPSSAVINLIGQIPVCPEDVSMWADKYVSYNNLENSHIKNRILVAQRGREISPPMSSVLDEETFNFLSEMMSFYSKRRLSAKEALDHEWLKEHRDYISEMRQKHLVIHFKKEIEVTFPSRSIREKIKEFIYGGIGLCNTIDGLFSDKWDDEKRKASQLCMSLDLYYRVIASKNKVIEDDLECSYYAVLYLVCLGIAIKYHRTNRNIIPYDMMVCGEMREYLTPEYLSSREKIVIDMLEKKFYNTTAATVVIEMGYCIKDYRDVLEYYFAGREGVHNVREEMEKVLIGGER